MKVIAVGVLVVRARNTVQLGHGLEVGFSIVILAIILDPVFHLRGAPGR